MTDTQHDPAATLWHGTTAVQRNLSIARDTYHVRLNCPPIAAAARPGQFVMLRLPGDDPLLGRPFAIYDVLLDTHDRPVGLDIVYLVVGKMTRRLAMLRAGDPLEIWGPLGNGFPPVPTEHLVMVAGGIGQTPFLTLAQQYLGHRSYGILLGEKVPEEVPRVSAVTLCYGARSEVYLAGIDDFQAVGVDVRLSTDDGSAGHHGPVTELIEPVVKNSPSTCRIVCCGPRPMLKATAEIARRLGVSCQVSLETPMACGVGICFSCVTKIHDPAGPWDYRRTCVEGPVFDAEQVDFSLPEDA